VHFPPRHNGIDRQDEKVAFAPIGDQDGRYYCLC